MLLRLIYLISSNTVKKLCFSFEFKSFINFKWKIDFNFLVSAKIAFVQVHNCVTVHRKMSTTFK